MMNIDFGLWKRVCLCGLSDVAAHLAYISSALVYNV